MEVEITTQQLNSQFTTDKIVNYKLHVHSQHKSLRRMPKRSVASESTVAAAAAVDVIINAPAAIEVATSTIDDKIDKMEREKTLAIYKKANEVRLLKRTNPKKGSKDDSNQNAKEVAKESEIEGEKDTDKIEHRSLISGTDVTNPIALCVTETVTSSSSKRKRSIHDRPEEWRAIAEHYDLWGKSKTWATFKELLGNLESSLLGDQYLSMIA